MSTLKPLSEKFKINNREHDLKFTVNVIGDIQDTFDISIASLGELFKDERNQLSNANKILAIMVNDDIDRMNDSLTVKIPHIDARYIGRYKTASETLKAFNGVNSIYHDNMDTEDGGEEEDPNPQSEQQIK